MEKKYKLITKITELDTFRKDLEATDVICLDTETTSLDPFEAELLLVQAYMNGMTYVIDCRILGKKYSTYLVELMEASNKTVILHNAKFDLKIIKHILGVTLTNVHCTMITETIITNGIGDKYPSLQDLVAKYLDITLDKTEQIGFIYVTPEMMLTESQYDYAAEDVAYLNTIRLYQLGAISESKQDKIYDIEMKLIPVLVDMELTGVILDPVAWNSLDNIYAQKVVDTEKQILEYFISTVDWSKFPNALSCLTATATPVSGKARRASLELVTDLEEVKSVLREKININSSDQLKALLGLVGLTLESTGEKVLNDYKYSYEIIRTILEFREYKKKVDTYGTDFLKHIHPKTGRVHTDYNPTGGRSGRLSSAKPNLQNIPKDSDYRHCFVAGAGKVFICADYSQQEYRLAGAISREPKIVAAYLAGLDMHTATAAEILGKPLEEVTKDERNWAKSINFAVLYGSTEYGLAFNLGIDVDTARGFLHKFFEGYPVLTAFKKSFEQEVLNSMFSVTVLGRRRYFENKDFFSGSKEMEKYRNRIRREGFNHPIQGTAADMTKIAMIIAWYNNPFGEKLKMLLQVHDELIFESDDDIKDQALEYVRECMVSAGSKFLGEIPTEVEIKISKEWSK